MRDPVDHIRNEAGMVYGPGGQAIEKDCLGRGDHQAVKEPITGNLAFERRADVGNDDIKDRQHTSQLQFDVLHKANHFLSL